MSNEQKNELNVYADLVKLYPENETYLRKYIDILLQEERHSAAAEAIRQLHSLLLSSGREEAADNLTSEFPQIGRIRSGNAPYEDNINLLLPSMMQNNLWLRLHQHKLKEGRHLIHRGDHEETVYLVCEGELAEFVRNSEGKPVLLNLIGAGNVVGEGHLFNPGPHLSDIVANKDSIIAKLPRKRMLATLDTHPILKSALQRKADVRRTVARISVCPLLQNVPLEMRKQLAEVSRTREYAAGDTVHKPGEKFDHVDLVAKGSASFQLLEKGIFKELKTLGPGSLVGESATTHEQGAPAEMVANSTLIIVEIPYSEFTSVAEAYPPLSRALLAYAEKNQSQIMSKLNELQSDQAGT
ncbi:Cyclic nucleotide-binding domain-containing protein [Mariprofundus ferrinatatus]|uniref:Cyclic nucleotide-binding domain-containing protein n=1 Tax=Mariprofundus ferrinatatus TaxID=1921087 RepID=A0A2K8L421_9PROT|nr:cyclic nucleotide-binding domain-containing protein [Mariprofundus ferrinatatus]ATX82078.1 Cyclic nucleotide-binding domain-containing protein [Mariprofundus ferrinatatus]